MNLTAIFSTGFSFQRLSGIDAIDRSIDKFRDLRDTYREANRQYYGEYLMAILEER